MPGYAFKTEGWEQFLKVAGALGQVVVRAGVIGEAAAEPHGDSDLSTGEVAIIHEYGAERAHIPPRPWVLRTILRERATAALRLKSATIEVIAHGGAPRAALEGVGRWLAEAMRRTIAEGVEPALAPSTSSGKDAARADVPLLDTGQMYAAIGSDVKLGSEVPNYEYGAVAGIERELGGGE